MNGRSVTCAGLVTVLLLTALSSAAVAEAGEKRIRAGFVYAVPTDDFTDQGSTTELDEATGLQVSYEQLVADSIGIEVGLANLGHDITVSEAGFPDIGGEVDLTLLTVSVNFHLMEDKPADFYVGPTLGFTMWDDVELDPFAEEFPVDDGVIYGVNMGFDVPIGKGKWGFNAALNYLFSEVAVEGGADIGVDPLHVKIGVVYKF